MKGLKLHPGHTAKGKRHFDATAEEKLIDFINSMRPAIPDSTHNALK